MDKSLEDMECQLEDMYNSIKRIRILKKNCEALEEHIKSANYNIKNLANNAPSGVSAINYDTDRVQTSKRYHCSTEQQLTETLIKYEEKIIRLNEKIMENEDEIYYIEESIMDLIHNVEELEEGSKKFIEFKYRDGKSIYQIADYFSIDKNTAYRRRDSILRSIVQRANFKVKNRGIN